MGIKDVRIPCDDPMRWANPPGGIRAASHWNRTRIGHQGCPANVPEGGVVEVAARHQGGGPDPDDERRSDPCKIAHIDASALF
jgi:hypothetical protein